jgi:imidazolonepropionase-like amidohydrolase
MTVLIPIAEMITLVLAVAIPAAANAQEPVSAAPLVIDGVTVVDVERGTLLPDRRVVVDKNRIRAVGDSVEVKVPKGARVIDARGNYLMPGLWDMHVHPRWVAHVYYPLFI